LFAKSEKQEGRCYIRNGLRQAGKRQRHAFKLG
jgi:hypothetical protein